MGPLEEDNDLYSYTIVTTTPNELMSGLHNRMPAILNEEHFDTWLDPESDVGMLEHLLKPYEGDLEAYPVDKRMGKVNEDDEGLLEPLD